MTLSRFGGKNEWNFGWLNRPDEVRRILFSLPFPYYNTCARHLVGTGEGKTVLLSDIAKKILGNYIPAQKQPRGTCFPKGTLILMETGKEKPIEEVLAGDFVFTHTGRIQKVLQTSKRYYDNAFVTLMAVSKKTLTLTEEHPVAVVSDSYNEPNWTAAHDLKVGNKILVYDPDTNNRNTHIIDALYASTIGKQEVYNLDVDVDHSYVANRVVVHNCVSRGYSRAVDYLQLTQMANGSLESFESVSHSYIYGCSREVGNFLSHEDGSVGAWAAKAVTTLGSIRNQDCSDKDQDYDDLAVEWGAKGVPSSFKDIGKQHLVRTTTLVNTPEQVRDMICNGYPVPVCSDQGFTMERDKDGKCSPQGIWGHCLLASGFRSDKSQFLIEQSWGRNCPEGPLGDIDIPDNSFWIDWDVMAHMASQQDTFSLSAYDGFFYQKPLDWLI